VLRTTNFDRSTFSTGRSRGEIVDNKATTLKTPVA